MVPAVGFEPTVFTVRSVFYRHLASAICIHWDGALSGFDTCISDFADRRLNNSAYRAYGGAGMDLHPQLAHHQQSLSRRFPKLYSVLLHFWSLERDLNPQLSCFKQDTSTNWVTQSGPLPRSCPETVPLLRRFSLLLE